LLEEAVLGGSAVDEIKKWEEPAHGMGEKKAVSPVGKGTIAKGGGLSKKEASLLNEKKRRKKALAFSGAGGEEAHPRPRGKKKTLPLVGRKEECIYDQKKQKEILEAVARREGKKLLAEEGKKNGRMKKTKGKAKKKNTSPLSLEEGEGPEYLWRQERKREFVSVMQGRGSAVSSEEEIKSS